MNKFKERLNYLQKKTNKTLRDIQDDTGINKSTLSRITTGQGILNDKILTTLAAYFNVSKAFLLGETELLTPDEEFPLDITILMREAVDQGISAKTLQSLIDVILELKKNQD